MCFANHLERTGLNFYLENEGTELRLVPGSGVKGDNLQTSPKFALTANVKERKREKTLGNACPPGHSTMASSLPCSK